MIDTRKSIILDLANRFGSESLDKFCHTMAASDRIEDLYRLGLGDEA